MKLPQIISKWSEILANDFTYSRNLANQMIKENKMEALKHIFQVYKHRDLVQSFLDSVRLNLNSEIQRQRFTYIEEEDKSDYIEKIAIQNSDNFYLSREESLKSKDKDFKEMCIYILKGWAFGSRVDDEHRQRFIEDVISSFNITGRIRGKDIELKEDIIARYLEQY